MTRGKILVQGVANFMGQVALEASALVVAHHFVGREMLTVEATMLQGTAHSSQFFA